MAPTLDEPDISPQFYEDMWYLTESQPSAAKRRSPIAELQSACAADKEAATQHGQWWEPVTKVNWCAPPGSSAAGVDAATSAWTRTLSGETLGKEPSPDDTQKDAPLARAAQGRKLAAWKEFNACPQVSESTIVKTIVGARWVSI